jgi:hypothetical protein
MVTLVFLCAPGVAGGAHVIVNGLPTNLNRSKKHHHKGISRLRP